MQDDPLWHLYWDHMSEVECEDANGVWYLGYSMRSWTDCDTPGCFFCDSENYVEEEE